MKKKPEKVNKKGAGLTLEDLAHFVIYRELDKLNVLFPYEKATRICNELREAVSYRAPKVKNPTTSSAAVLSAKDIQRAVDMIREYDKQPFISHIGSKYPWWNLLEKSVDARNFSLYGGIQCVLDESVPANIARFFMSDGTHKDIEITNKPTLLPTNTHP